jgi:hypothetical protein
MARPSCTIGATLTASGGEERTMTITVLGIDLGKNSCSVVGLDETGRVVLRDRVVPLGAKLPACVMAMEACCGAHHLGRVLREPGHEVRLMSPEYVQPYVKVQKNDERDAETIAEAATRPTMHLPDQKLIADSRRHQTRGVILGEGGLAALPITSLKYPRPLAEDDDPLRQLALYGLIGGPRHRDAVSSGMDQDRPLTFETPRP